MILLSSYFFRVRDHALNITHVGKTKFTRLMFQPTIEVCIPTF